MNQKLMVSAVLLALKKTVEAYPSSIPAGSAGQAAKLLQSNGNSFFVSDQFKLDKPVDSNDFLAYITDNKDAEKQLQMLFSDKKDSESLDFLLSDDEINLDRIKDDLIIGNQAVSIEDGNLFLLLKAIENR